MTDIESEEQSSSENGLFSRMARGASERVFDVVDPNLVLDHVDVNALLDRVDVNHLLDRVDVNTLLDRVDVDELLDRVDVDRLLERADVDALMDRVDVRAIVDKAGIPEIVAESTGHLTGSALDLFRRPIVGIDEIIFRSLNALFRRDPNTFPTGPGQLAEWIDGQAPEGAGVKTGRYAGPLTRLLAILLDTVIVTTGFTLITAGIVFLGGLVGIEVDLTGRGFWFLAAYVSWAFVYLWVSFAVFGKTLGKTVLGVRVVGADGTVALRGGQAFLRALTFPLSFVLLGIGLLGIVFGRERRAWHDHFAGSAVVYDWGTRTARMPTPLADWLARRQTE